jgi:dTDP-4-amino-4,6-dideoxygalactose transaminase
MRSSQFALSFANPQAQYLSMKSEIDDAISKVLVSDSYILGSEVASFEQEFAKYNDISFAVGVNSGTDAIVLSLRALKIGPGDEVIVPSFTAVATVAAITAVGATPILIDIYPSTYTLDFTKFDQVRSKLTKAVIAVHLYGHPADMDLISRWCVENEVYLIEDCAQAHGAAWQSRKVGTFGSLACFSFYPTKNLGAIGDGGAVVTDDPQLRDRLIELRQYGWDNSRDSQVLSTVSRLDELQAAILRVKLRKLDQLNDSRIKIANQYLENLNPIKYVLPTVADGARHVFHLFVVRVQNRETLLEHLNEFNIRPGIHYPRPVHLNSAYKALGNNARSTLYETEKASQTVLSLPMYPELTENEVSFITEVLNSV